MIHGIIAMPIPSDSGPRSGRPQATRPLFLSLSGPETIPDNPPDGMAESWHSLSVGEIHSRIEALGLDKTTKERIRYFLLRRTYKGKKDCGRLEGLIEQLPEKYPEIGLYEWAHICQTVLPEIYGEPPPSFKPSHSVPGSKSRLWRLAERWRLGYALFHPRDSMGVRYDALQLEIFDEKIGPEDS